MTSASAGGLPVGTLTFILTDIESSTKLWELDPESMNPAVERHEELIRETVTRHSGQVVRERGEGDSTFSVFKKASGAAAAAVELQVKLAKERWPGDLPIRVRIGIHTGEASLRAGNYYGQTINRTARLRDVAHGGQAVLSQATYELIRDDLPDGASIVALGHHRLRDLHRQELIFQLEHPEAPSKFPPLRSLGSLPNNLPVQLTSFIGREEQIEQVKSLISVNKLVTITGPGGFGKTRLALQVAAEVLEDFSDGVWLVELASLRDALLVPDEIAAQMGVRQALGAGSELGSPRSGSSGPDKDLITLIGTKRMLLVLDNCEHLVASVASLVESLLRGCENLHVLTTSRERLWVAGETLLIVPPLESPETEKVGQQLDELAQFEAVRLFNERASQARPGFEMTKENAGPIVEITRQLEGMPLGIELAAARLRVLTPAQISERLNERFRLLTGPPRAIESRHQTLRAVVDW
ncbi:MAG: adenylate/guanylate cyclase domain-containing protein, partial [Acidimicrobiia bacterium]